MQVLSRNLRCFDQEWFALGNVRTDKLKSLEWALYPEKAALTQALLLLSLGFRVRQTRAFSVHFSDWRLETERLFSKEATLLSETKQLQRHFLGVSVKNKSKPQAWTLTFWTHKTQLQLFFFHLEGSANYKCLSVQAVRNESDTQRSLAAVTRCGWLRRLPGGSSSLRAERRDEGS